MLPDHGGNTVPDLTHSNAQKIKKMIYYSTVFINEEEEVFFFLETRYREGKGNALSSHNVE